MLKLIEIDETLRKETLDYQSEFKSNDERIHGSAGLTEATSFEEWLSALKDNEKIETLRPGRVLATTYFAQRIEDGKIVGIIDIRHTLNEYMFQFGGHIGYSIRKSERRKGYAKEMLGLALQKCKDLKLDRVLITCDQDNLASARTIMSQGGVLENEVMNDGKMMQRYWIQC
ncbi:MAG TPA: GNAT family N-acetyltransferase [Erysipelotrichaceae bacterium]|nr:MAG: GNAT family N-acetyltransferase [Firmicutes bacterium GWE2_51_13]HBZ42107.1 GNAT family N-acetyltransferase [Erysipelotrichaceae bacterium]